LEAVAQVVPDLSIRSLGCSEYLYALLRASPASMGQVDLKACTLTVGQSKTESGTGRLLPLNDRAVAILSFWASLFQLRDLSHFVFPAEATELLWRRSDRRVCQ